MVKLNKIYTRTGDDGTTGLGTGERRFKHDLRIEAYGTVDETNAAIGLVRLHTAATEPLVDAMLGRIQNDLFDLGADLCTPEAKNRCPTSLYASCRHRSNGLNKKLISSMPRLSRSTPLSCRVVRLRRPRYISPAPFAAAQNG